MVESVFEHVKDLRMARERIMVMPGPEKKMAVQSPSGILHHKKHLFLTHWNNKRNDQALNFPTQLWTSHRARFGFIKAASQLNEVRL